MSQIWVPEPDIGFNLAKIRRSVSDALETTLGWQVFSIPVVAVVFTASFLTRLAGVPTDPKLSPLTNFWVSLVITAASYAWLALWLLPLFRWLPQARFAQVLALLSAGTIRGIVLQAILDTYKQSTAEQQVSRLISSTVIFGLAITITGYTAGTINSRARRLHEITAVSETLANELKQNQARIEGWYSSLASNIKVRLKREIDRSLADSSAMNDMALGLKDQVADLVRPLSHDLMRQSPSWQPTATRADMTMAGFFSLISQALEMPWKIYPAVSLFLAFLASLEQYLHFGGPNKVALLILAVVLGLMGLYATQLLLSRTNSKGHWINRFALFYALTVALQIPSSLVATSIVSPVGPAQNLSKALLLSATMGLSTWLVSVAAATRTALKLDEIKLNESRNELRWLVARTSAVMWERQRDLSRILHGPVQSAISAAAIRLDLAKDDPAEMARIVVESRESINRAVNEITHPKQAPHEALERLNSVAEAWDGVATISTTIEPGLERVIDRDASCSRILVEIVLEAIGNAVRHGGATQVSVEVAAHRASAVKVLVSDNGAGLNPAARQGLGSQLLTECTLGWRRYRSGDQTVLECLLPLNQS